MTCCKDTKRKKCTKRKAADIQEHRGGFLSSPLQNVTVGLSMNTSWEKNVYLVLYLCKNEDHKLDQSSDSLTSTSSNALPESHKQRAKYSVEDLKGAPGRKKTGCPPPRRVWLAPLQVKGCLWVDDVNNGVLILKTHGKTRITHKFGYL